MLWFHVSMHGTGSKKVTFVTIRRLFRGSLE
jgi:hypothetical protein